MQVVGNSGDEPAHDELMEGPVPDRIKHENNRHLNDDDIDMNEGSFANRRPAISPPTQFCRPRGEQQPQDRVPNSGITEESAFWTLLLEIQKTQNMVLEFTNQGSGGHTTPHRQRPREFKPPVKRNQDANQTETLGWLRQCMNKLMRIKHDKDVFDDKELQEPNTPKKRIQEKSVFARLFVAHCKDNGDGDKVGTDKDQYDIHEMFMDHLHCLKNLIRQSQPKPNEDQETLVERLDSKKKRDRECQRHHGWHKEWGSAISGSVTYRNITA
ncbi:hypothetical protein BYT27DRAFT_7208934 [Phlegmacium glaucopus]|nr:hypothetical protein BYT27DRAFT_7208934 [Phlegmacium glaucopus]